MSVVAPNRSFPFTDKDGYADGERVRRWIEEVTRITNQSASPSVTPTRVTVATYTTVSTDEVIFYNTDAQSSALTLEPGTLGRTMKIINSGTSGNNLTVNGNASEKVMGATALFTLLDVESLIITYDTTDGWM